MEPEKLREEMAEIEGALAKLFAAIQRGKFGTVFAEANRVEVAAKRSLFALDYLSRFVDAQLNNVQMDDEYVQKAKDLLKAAGFSE